MCTYDVGAAYLCDYWAQGCPCGQKCAVWALDADGYWDSSRCVPVTGDGVAGDPCTAPAGPKAGEDDCALGHMCWYIDSETLSGTCVELCTGTPEGATCPPGHLCALCGGCVPNPCLPFCDPLINDCPDNGLCSAWSGVDLVCHNDASDGLHPPGTPCEYNNQCNPGSLCLTTSYYPHPDCEGSGRCCAPACDLNDPQCPAEPQGLSCEPWYAQGQAPEGHEHVGVCFVPP